MIAAIDSPVEAPKPARARSPRKPVAQATKSQGERTPKSQDPGMAKVSLYLPVETAKKLGVAVIIRGKGADMSDVAADILGRALSSVTFYEKPATRPSDQTLTVESIDADVAA